MKNFTRGNDRSNNYSGGKETVSEGTNRNVSGIVAHYIFDVNFDITKERKIIWSE